MAIKMTCLNHLDRRSFLKIAALLGGASTVGALPNLAGAQDAPQQISGPTDAETNLCNGWPLQAQCLGYANSVVASKCR